MFPILIGDVNANKYSLLLFPVLTSVQLQELSLANIWSMCLCSTLCFISAPRTREDNLPLPQKTSSLAIGPNIFFYHLEDTGAISPPPPAPTTTTATKSIQLIDVALFAKAVPREPGGVFEKHYSYYVALWDELATGLSLASLWRHGQWRIHNQHIPENNKLEWAQKTL